MIPIDVIGMQIVINDLEMHPRLVIRGNVVISILEVVLLVSRNVVRLVELSSNHHILSGERVATVGVQLVDVFLEGVDGNRNARVVL